MFPVPQPWYFSSPLRISSRPCYSSCPAASKSSCVITQRHSIFHGCPNSSRLQAPIFPWPKLLTKVVLLNQCSPFPESQHLTWELFSPHFFWQRRKSLEWEGVGSGVETSPRGANPQLPQRAGCSQLGKEGRTERCSWALTLGHEMVTVHLLSRSSSPVTAFNLHKSLEPVAEGENPVDLIWKATSPEATSTVSYEDIGEGSFKLWMCSS